MKDTIMRVIGSLLTAIFFVTLLVACEKADETELPQSAEAGEVATEQQSDHYDNMCVDVNVNEDGYYAYYADVDLYYTDGEITSIFLQDPTLLAFRVSSKYDGGVYILNQTDGNAIIDRLAEISVELENNGQGDLAEKLNEIISTLGSAGPYTNAST